MNCKHENCDKKRVMDMDFSVCNECGFQWKGHYGPPINKEVDNNLINNEEESK